MDRLIEIKIGGNHLWKDSNLAGVQGEGNVTDLRITFDEGWSGYAKSITFFNAKGKNPVKRTLTADLLEDITQSTLVYLCKIPPEPLTEAGRCSFVIEGYVDEKRQRVVETEMEVQPARDTDDAAVPGAPTPSQAEQIQAQIENILDDMQEQAIIATDAANNAKASEDNAKTAEDNAKLSEANAKTSAEAAEEARQAAEDSKDLSADNALRAEQALSQMGTHAEDAAQSAAEAKAAQAKAEEAEAAATESADRAAGAANGIQDKVDEAAASAAEAKASAQGVSAYADQAKASAQAAKTSETNAASSASSAKASENNVVSRVAAAESAKSDAESAAARAEAAQSAAESAKQAAASSSDIAAESARLAGLKLEGAEQNAELAQGYANNAFGYMQTAQDSGAAAVDAKAAAETAQAAAEAAQAAAENAAKEAQQVAGGDFATPAYVDSKAAEAESNANEYTDEKLKTIPSGKLSIVDNEWGVDYAPAWYMENKPEQVAAERRSPTTIGLEGRTYCTVLTYTHGSNSSYGYPVQIALVDGVVYVRRANGSSGWRGWDTLATQSDVEEMMGSGGSQVATATLPKGRMKGDVDGDGEVTVSDFLMLSNVDTTTFDDIQTWCADVNGDTFINTQDRTAVRAYVQKKSGNLTKKPYMADYYGNWTYVKVDDLSGYFYTDVAVGGVTVGCSAIVAVQGNHKRDAFAGAECFDGYVRVKANILPLADSACLVFYSPGDGTAVVVPENVVDRVGAPLALSLASSTMLKSFSLTIDDDGTITATSDDGTAYTFTGVAVT